MTVSLMLCMFIVLSFVNVTSWIALTRVRFRILSLIPTSHRMECEPTEHNYIYVGVVDYFVKE